MTNKKKGKVGYGHPPEAGQFGKGQNAINRKGRPKGSKNFATRYKAELDSKVPVTENGKRKQVSKLDVIIKQQVTRGAAGDPKIGQLVLDRAAKLEERDQAVAPVSPFTDADREVIRAVYERLVKTSESNDSNC